jgi:hypothetical protein
MGQFLARRGSEEKGMKETVREWKFTERNFLGVA